jgi:hypothetical protein
MGRKTDILNDEKQQLSSDTIEHESQMNFNQDLDLDDPLIHDTILPHRKRIRKDPLQYIQSQQSSTSCPNVDVSFVR